MRNALWIAALAVSLSAGAASAQSAESAAELRAEAAVSAPAVQADVRADARADSRTAAAPADPHCLRQTGSRVAARGKRGCAGYGRSYERTELQRTGETDLGQALRKLDPRLN